jgi:hypothetical protein
MILFANQCVVYYFYVVPHQKEEQIRAQEINKISLCQLQQKDVKQVFKK